MSKELQKVIDDSLNRMKQITSLMHLPDYDIELNITMWWEAFDRGNAAQAAMEQQQGIKYTTKGDFSHLQSTGAINFVR